MGQYGYDAQRRQELPLSRFAGAKGAVLYRAWIRHIEFESKTFYRSEINISLSSSCPHTAPGQKTNYEGRNEVASGNCWKQ